jgi:hypothetical protein
LFSFCNDGFSAIALLVGPSYLVFSGSYIGKYLSY